MIKHTELIVVCLAGGLAGAVWLYHGIAGFGRGNLLYVQSTTGKQKANGKRWKNKANASCGRYVVRLQLAKEQDEEIQR